MVDDLLTRIRSQRALSEEILETVLPVIGEIYYPDLTLEEIPCGDMSSFVRGTNNEVSPDLDLVFLEAPREESRGFKDWTSIGTKDLTGRKEGIVTLDELEGHDPLLARAARRCGEALERRFGPGGKFEYVRTWPGFRGVMVSLSQPAPEIGKLSIDVNLVYESGHFGVEHQRRFLAYFDRVLDVIGTEAAVRLVDDIRFVKRAGKENALGPDGWVDRTRKLAGFVVEGLFCRSFPPASREEVMRRIREHRWPAGAELRDGWIGDQADQVVDADFTFAGLLECLALENAALPKGAWENLLSIARGD